MSGGRKDARIVSFFRPYFRFYAVPPAAYPRTRRASCISFCLTATLLFGSLFVGVKFVEAQPVALRFLNEYEPIMIKADDPVVPGQPLACDVELTGGPATVTITSDPPGAVSYQGTVNSSTATVQAQTSSSASGTITLYAETGGAEVVSTQVFVRTNTAVPEIPSTP